MPHAVIKGLQPMKYVRWAMLVARAKQTIDPRRWWAPTTQERLILVEHTIA